MQERIAAFKGHLRHICYYTAVYIPSPGKTILKKEKIPQNQLMTQIPCQFFSFPPLNDALPSNQFCNSVRLFTVNWAVPESLSLQTEHTLAKRQVIPRQMQHRLY